MKTQPRQFDAYLVFAALIFAISPTLGFTWDHPATEPTCDGIEEAYPILGSSCKKNYSKIDHAPNNPKERLKTFIARRAVMKIVKKASLCNGMRGANKRNQQNFNSQVEGHLMAIANLRLAMVAAGDSNVPSVFTDNELKLISMTKQECK